MGKDIELTGTRTGTGTGGGFAPLDQTDAEYCDDGDDGFEDEYSGNIGALPTGKGGGHFRSRPRCVAVVAVLAVATAAVYYGMTEYGNADLLGLKSDTNGDDPAIIDEDDEDAGVEKASHVFNDQNPHRPRVHGHNGKDWSEIRSPFNESDYHANEEYWIFGRKRNRTQDAMDAYAQRWNRTHPDTPFPGFEHFGGKGSGAFGGKFNACRMNHVKNREWIKAKITLGDGKKFEVVGEMEHDPQAFTQGLTYADGVLYESTGLYGQSTVRILDPKTAKVQKSVTIPNEKFGEGMTIFKGDQLIQLTWKRQPLTGYIYNATTLELIKDFTFSTTHNQGWGITYDECHNHFIVTDGSEYLHFWNADDLTEIRRVRVQRQSGKPAKELNEIELYRGRVLSNVWFEDTLLVINPLTGEVEKEYDFSSLWPKSERNPRADVFNGISVSEDPDVLYVTGKQWGKMFKVKLEPFAS